MQQQQRSSAGLIALLLVALVVAILYTIARVGGNQSSFDAAPFAVQIAQKASQYRAKHKPTGHNFGGGAIIVEFSDGTSSTYPSDIYEGQDGPPLDKNAFHSERQTQEDFVLPTLSQLQQRGIIAKAIAIHVVIFSQYAVCNLCKAEMRAWQDQARKAAGSLAVDMTVWELVQYFYPLDRDPRNRQQPVVNGEQDIEQVAITFDQVWTPTPFTPTP